MGALFKKVRGATGVHGIKCLFYSSSQSESEMDPFRLLRQNIKQNKDVSAIILICTSKQGIVSKFFNSDHWLAFVVNIKESMHEYALADSLLQNRLKDPRVKCLMDYLEGKRETLEMPQQEIPVLAIVGVAGGVVCVVFFHKRKKDAQKKKTWQSQSAVTVKESTQPFQIARDLCNDSMTDQSEPCKRKETDEFEDDDVAGKSRQLVQVHRETSVAA